MKKLSLILILSLALVACGESKKDSGVSTTTTTANQVQTTVTNPPNNEVIVVDPPASTTTTTNSGPKKIAPKPVVAATGIIGHINIPSINVDWDIREGIELSVLNKSPGHYPHSPKPCRAGNAAIAGHRTTYGAPFNRLDLLKDGDVVNITTPEGDCVYKYLRTEIVSPTNIDVVNPKGGNFLTLTACHPKGSAAKRITVTFSLESVTVK